MTVPRLALEVWQAIKDEDWVLSAGTLHGWARKLWNFDLQPDGDLMYDAGALWMATKYEIPLLIVMYNNRAYYNDWNHQIVMARTRGRDPSCAHIGMDLFGPAPDFAGLARSMAGGPKAL